MQESLAVAVRIEMIQPATRWLAEWCAAQEIPVAAIHKLDVCLNEALANLVVHAGLPLDAKVQLTLDTIESGGQRAVTLRIEDSGQPFDPVTYQPRTPPATLADARPGGLGVLMMQQHADSLEYEYANKHNNLLITVLAGQLTDQSAAVPFRRSQSVAERTEPEGKVLVERRKASLNWVPLFRGASEVELLAAIGDCLVLPVLAGSELLHAGEENQSVYVLLSGELEARLASSSDGSALISLGPGECIGEMSAIDGKRVSASVVAVTDSRVLKLTKDAFWERLMTLPGVARNLLVSLTERMRRTNELALQSQRTQLELAHLRRELTVAHDLQISMVPMQRPIFPHRSDVEVCGFMEPASTVGGDFFDAFFVEENRLFICIGDVSGHGIAAALLMARIIGLVRIVALDYPEPDRLLSVLNDRLCDGNKTEMYATMFCAFLDTGTGTLLYSNAGHCAPLIVGADAASQLVLPHGPLVGAFPGVTYTAMKQQLHRGDVLFCYTDGLTEAENAATLAFGEDRCRAHLEATRGLQIAVMLESFRKALGDYGGSTELADDCTMLAARWKG